MDIGSIRTKVRAGKYIISFTHTEKLRLRRIEAEEIGKRERRGLDMLDKCYFCKADVVQQHVTIDYRWGDTLVIIKDVPAAVCQQCWEKYLSSSVYKELERLAKNKNHITDKMTVDILAFEESPAV